MDYRVLIQNETTLQHHGIRGMKWGRRKNVNEGSTSSNSERRKKLIKRIAIAAGTTAVVAGAAYAANRYAKSKGSNSYKLSIDKTKYKLKQPLSYKLIKSGLGYRAPNGRVNNIGDKVGIYYDNNKLKYDPHASIIEKDSRGYPKYYPKFYGEKPSHEYVDKINRNTFTGTQTKYRYKGRIRKSKGNFEKFFRKLQKMSR